MLFVMFLFLLPLALLMTGLSYLLTAGKRRKERAFRAQLVENSKNATAQALQEQREAQAREASRQRKMIERAARFGPGYNSRLPFDN